MNWKDIRWTAILWMGVWGAAFVATLMIPEEPITEAFYYFGLAVTILLAADLLNNS